MAKDKKKDEYTINMSDIAAKSAVTGGGQEAGVLNLRTYVVDRKDNCDLCYGRQKLGRSPNNIGEGGYTLQHMSIKSSTHIENRAAEFADDKLVEDETEYREHCKKCNEGGCEKAREVMNKIHEALMPKIDKWLKDKKKDDKNT